MVTDFSRTLSLLRQEKGLSQRKAAAALGISQALLSHYENGIREPGLAFVTKVCNFYHVSADYLLGRTASRDGAMIEYDDLYDSSDEKGTLKGSIMATLQKKLVVNTTGVVFDLLGKLGDRQAITAAGDYLSSALYQLLRQLYRRSGGNEDFFAVDADAFDAGLVEADMTLARTRYGTALAKVEEFPPLTSDTITAYPGLGQSVAQVIHNTDERCKKLGE
ncbi:MAG: helix-turn-helix transcriptional regulator [Eubacteriales bacterium]|nr:helix-turn-helix transcriptional regulator [Eubacteriales bacterium]